MRILIFFAYNNYMKKYMRKLLFLCAALCFLSACTVFDPDTCAVFSFCAGNACGIPPDFDFWQIIVHDGGSEKAFTLEKTAETFSMELPKNVVLGILAYPVKDGKMHDPCGAVYPYSSALDEKGGFCAYIADRLYRGSSESKEISQDYISRFNWQKFINACNDFENPWNLDADRIVEKIASGTFKKSDLKMPDN